MPIRRGRNMSAKRGKLRQKSESVRISEGSGSYNNEAEDEAFFSDHDGGSKSMAKKHVVRSHFPETWLFQLIPVDRHGKAVVKLKAPDTLTSWTGEAVCMSSKAGIGLAQPASILVKKVTVIIH